MPNGLRLVFDQYAERVCLVDSCNTVVISLAIDEFTDIYGEEAAARLAHESHAWTFRDGTPF